MIADNALANLCISSEMRRGGDTGRRMVEHRSFLKLRFTHNLINRSVISITSSKSIVRAWVRSSGW